MSSVSLIDPAIGRFKLGLALARCRLEVWRVDHGAHEPRVVPRERHDLARLAGCPVGEGQLDSVLVGGLESETSVVTRIALEDDDR